MHQAIRAGLCYFLAVFAVGFALGAVRVTFLVPQIGALAAVACELPLMLGASWFICGALLRRFVMPPGRGPRLVMGGTGFVLLIAAEPVLAVWGFGNTPAAFLADYAGAAGQLGLVGQIGFALLPLVRRRG
jgi:hypothetical protein